MKHYSFRAVWGVYIGVLLIDHRITDSLLIVHMTLMTGFKTMSWNQGIGLLEPHHSGFSSESSSALSRNRDNFCENILNKQGVQSNPNPKIIFSRIFAVRTKVFC